MNPDIALQKLVEGNKRYVNTIDNSAEMVTKLEHVDASAVQKPFAIILGCSDSRVPAELVFHQGLGDLFVIRIAGNIVEPSQIGSVEFACQQFGTQLVVVLGHTRCGAISATVDSLLSEPGEISPNLAAIVDRVAPAVLPVIAKQEYADKGELIQASMRANITQSVTGLEMRSGILRDLVKQNKLKIVGAEYSIETGKVDFHLPD